MASIIIDSNEYYSYVSVDDADIYFGAASHGGPWRAAETADKEMALVTATRTLDRQKWQGEMTNADQGAAWPRTGITGVDPAVVPQEVLDATCELALSILNGEAVQTNPNGNVQTIASQSAGSVSISYFRGAEGKPLRFPLIVMELIGKWLGGGSNNAALGFSSGTCERSTMAHLNQGRSRGF